MMTTTGEESFKNAYAYSFLLIFVYCIFESARCRYSRRAVSAKEDISALVPIDFINPTAKSFRGWLVGWSLTAHSAQNRLYRA